MPENEPNDQPRYAPTSLLRYILAGLAFLVLIAVFAWFFFFRHPDSDNQTAKNTKNGSSSQSSGKSGSSSGYSSGDTSGNSNSSKSSGSNGAGAEQSPSGSNSGSSQSSSSGNGSAGSSSAAAGENSELTNTGPGDIVALFIGTTIVAAALRRYQLARR